MLLIADSGSTKCDWVLLGKQSEVPIKFRTKGLNPSVLTKEELQQIIFDCTELLQYQNKIEKVFFFGAGCTSKETNLIMETILSKLFLYAKITVKEDTMAAVWATTTEPAVVCILGTGSNCCYFDGTDLQMKVPSLGYVLMDECSGNYFGKELLRAYFFNKMPQKIKLLFENQFSLEIEEVLNKIYQNSTPNEYLAQFAIFLIQNKKQPFLNAILFQGIHDFVENHIMQFEEELKTNPVCFVGSIAFYLQDEIKFVLESKGIVASKFVRRPMEAVIENIKNDILVI